jgi:hypothetical protein
MNWTPTITQGSLKHYSVKGLLAMVDRRVYVAARYT